MKILDQEPVFKPVIIAFESQDEIDYITALMGASGSWVATKMDLSINTSKLYEEFLTIARKGGVSSLVSHVIVTDRKNY